MSLKFASAQNQHAGVISLMPLVAGQLENFEKSTDARNPESSENPPGGTLATLVIGVKEDCDIRVKNPETNSKLYRMISRRHCRLEVRETALVLLDGAEAGATSKNGTYVGERRADAQEGIPLKDGDVLGLGAPAASDGFNPYNLVVGDVGAFLASVTAQVRKEREGGVEKTMTLMKIKREIGRHIMDVDAPGQPGIVDLTLDSDADADEKIAGGRVEIVLTASPPSWYRDGYAYQLADRNLVKPSRVAMLGQLQGEEIKLTMVPPEFILDVAMQGLMKDVWAKMVLETSKKITITGRSQAVSKMLVEAHALWMERCYMRNLNEDLADLLENLSDSDWGRLTCVTGSEGHLALPAVEGLTYYDEEPGLKCGMCALHGLSRARGTPHVAKGLKRDYSAETAAFKMLEDGGIMDKLKMIGLTRERFELQYNKLVQLAAEDRYGGGTSTSGKPAARKPAARKPAARKPAPGKPVPRKPAPGEPAELQSLERPPARAARLWADDNRFAVEKLVGGRCAECAEDLKEGMAFGILRKDSLTRWMHPRCVDGKLRMRALTEGLRGWSGMDAGQRQEVLRDLGSCA